MATISAVPADFLSTMSVPYAAASIGLVARAKAGDAAACHALFEAHAKRVYSWSLLVAGEPRDAETLTRDIFLAAFANLGAIASDDAFAVELRRQSAKFAWGRCFKAPGESVGRAASQARPAS